MYLLAAKAVESPPLRPKNLSARPEFGRFSQPTDPRRRTFLGKKAVGILLTDSRRLPATRRDDTPIFALLARWRRWLHGFPLPPLHLGAAALRRFRQEGATIEIPFTEPSRP
ncbi:MAG: hypothetical protein ABIP48_26040 [Planctomycetota bacterium]